MHVGIAVALGGGGVEKAGAIFPRQFQRIFGSLGADHQSFRAETSVIRWAGGGSEVKDVIDGAEVKRLADVLLYQAEPWFMGQLGQVGEPSGAKIVYSYDLIALSNERIREMRAKEAGGAGNQDTMSRQNAVSPLL
jgi:hypothetical protein